MGVNAGSDLGIAKEGLSGWPQWEHTGSKEEGAWGIDVGIGAHETDTDGPNRLGGNKISNEKKTCRPSHCRMEKEDQGL